MKKQIILLFALFPLWGLGGIYAQKELWGVNTGNDNGPGYYGNITKYDIYGENPVIMHEFDSIHGYNPKGRLFLASNGKLYGTTQKGGNIGLLGSNTTGGNFNIKVDNVKETATATVTDMTGKRLGTYPLTKGENKIKTKNLASGTYIVVVEIDGQTESQQIIIK